jgi:succinate dehydrogenase / fumarate reductase membrane anchor subunit
VSAILWVLHRTSGLALVVVAGLHVVVQAALFPVPIGRPVLLIVDWALLALALYHGLNGVRTVALDYVHRPPAQRTVSAALWVVGLGLFIYGGWGLLLLAR